MELVIATPLLLLLILLVVAAGVWMHAQHCAQAAADDATTTARAWHSSAKAGRTAGHHSLEALGGTILTDHNVTVDRGATTVHTEVTATVMPIIPGWEWRVHADADGPVERIVAAGDHP
ncbi:MAG: TadE/TadG family type IV pilus assembly protein [Stackebrandtia sp.]